MSTFRKIKTSQADGKITRGAGRQCSLRKETVRADPAGRG